MKALITPGKDRGNAIRIPGSKSISHRALIASALSEEPSVIRHPVKNEDTRATIACLSHLGRKFAFPDPETIEVSGSPSFSGYEGGVLDCSESGSTLRFLIPVFSLCEREVRFTGRGKLMKRPLTVYEDLFRSQNLLFETRDDVLHITGPIHGGKLTIRGDISSQFITGLLFALPLLEEDSMIEILPPYESRSYVTLTEAVLKRAGIMIKDHGGIIEVPGRQIYRPLDYDVAGDDSQAAFFACLALISHQPLTVLGMDHEAVQGDHVIVELFERFGGKSIPVPGGYRFEPGEIHACRCDLSDCPDLGPVLFALAAVSEGVSEFINCGRLRIKESDRIAAMKEELAKLGVLLEEEKDRVMIHGVSSIKGGAKLCGHNDHRIVMALSVLASAADGNTEIEGCEAVNKSYPEFFRDFEAAGGRVKLL
ncbi:MAG: 3-phosphoshikimate 1-carboxyvinyltransferase [Solobacterium sp.]|nr:3-phosphoshikimate 1-carboxyvinyltransferase [Solobacterium sp.]